MPNTTCLVVNHENITWNYYRGRDRAFLLAGALFRVGGAAALLSNRCGPASCCSACTHWSTCITSRVSSLHASHCLTAKPAHPCGA